ncbi:SusD/RagB family nutrient-binding outer membrane lipoprotein [Flavobacterium circumlabens]|uniref:SusD-like starch-binding protein associating with outer membrane n=1 Tax=Flavobacterium circumlabens TaxID=2133765 RepID=A0A4Y7UAM8_9FLAO|nr:SusD/RagB family nutrient-binding outer membrane lipoprotein [Flavobacterium circumlabens]TCN56305.1 SusD-like starch-binding protein associating with outer membrane [Flavobacterium circumlabens]TEB43344.1 SusD/RagB family nutrient-binding outer membrane lipoprotein [Flavobacterium circumlabens]
MKKIIAILTTGLLLTACVSEDINTDPNSAYTTVPGSLINYAEKELSDYLNTPSVNENNFRLTMQYWQETTYVNESNYDFTNRNVSNSIYTLNYVNVLKNLSKAKEIINAYSPTATELADWPTNKKNQLAIIEILEVFTYQRLVDTFGNIPYTQAGNVIAFPLPAYDDGATIYQNLISRIDAAIPNLVAVDEDHDFDTFTDGDKYYGGDASKWRKFANSLKLKLAIGIADSNPSLAQTTATSAITAGVMTSPADNCQFQYLAASPNYNPLFENLSASGRNDFFAGKTLVDYMNATNDPRIGHYFDEVEGGGYVGQVIGEGGEFGDFSNIGAFAYTATTPGIILNYTEVAFYIAEANARWNPAAAATAYNTAVTASIVEWGGTPAEAVTYLATHPYDAVNWKKSIGEQAWVAMFNQAQTSWNFWRRLDFPVLTAPATAIINAGGKVPVRMAYPVLEQQVNSSNWKAASTAIGGDLLTTKLFWDKF